MSEKILKVPYDKSKWARGEWDNEPDRVDFIHAGFSCLILRNMTGNWCGYVGVPQQHPAYNMEYDDIPVDVHGGLTYKETCNGAICHIPEPNMPDHVMWLGFDTAHFGDLSPGMMYYWKENKIRMFDGDTYKNQEYVTNETKQLAEQLAGMK